MSRPPSRQPTPRAVRAGGRVISQACIQIDQEPLFGTSKATAANEPKKKRIPFSVSLRALSDAERLRFSHELDDLASTVYGVSKGEALVLLVEAAHAKKLQERLREVA